MPKVPVIETNRIQSTIGQPSKSSMDAPLAAFGGGKEVDNAFTNLQKTFELIKNHAENLELKEAETKLNNFENDFFYGKKDPDTGEQITAGAYQAKGKNAFKLTEDFDNAWNDKIKEINDGLSSGNVKNAFSNVLSSKKQLMYKTISNHQASEIEKYKDSVTSNYLESEQQNAINNYQDSKRIFDSINNQKETFTLHGKAKGMSDIEILNGLKELESRTHLGVINRMTDNEDDFRAEKYFESVKDSLTPKAYSKAKDLVEYSSIRGRSMKLTDEYMKNGLNETQALNEVSKIENSKLRMATESRINFLYGIKDRALKDAQEKMFLQATKIIDQTGDINKVPPSLVQNLPPHMKEGINSYYNRNPMRDDGKVFYDIYDLALNKDTRKEFIDYDLTKEFGNLSKDHREKLMTMQKQMREDFAKGGKGENAIDGLYSDSQVADNIYKLTYGQNAIKSKNKDYYLFRTLLDSQIETAKKNKGVKNLPNEDVESIAHNIMKKVVTDKGTFWNTEVPMYQVINEIPDKKKEEYELILKKLGKPVTQENMTKFYLYELDKKNKGK